MVPRQAKHDYRLLIRIDDPVFGDPRPSILAALDGKIAIAIFPVAADNLHYQIGPVPKFFTHATGMFFRHEYKVGFTEFAGP